VFADIRDLYDVVLELFHGDDGKSVGGELGNNKWVGVVAALVERLLFDVCLKFRNGKYLRNGCRSALVGVGKISGFLAAQCR
jgi:hypothetical protein